jgi:hypothetical protein
MEPIAEWTVAAIEDRQERLIRILLEDLGLIRRDPPRGQPTTMTAAPLTSR